MSDIVADLATLESERWEAIVGSDTHRLEALFHDDLSYTHSNGMTDTKRSYLEALAAGTYRYRSARSVDVQTHAFENAVVVTGQALLVADVGGQPVDIVTRYSAVWLNHAGTWQLVCWHSCPGTL